MDSKILPFSHYDTHRRGVDPWWYSELLEYTNDAIIVWGLDGVGIQFWNRAAELLYGYRAQDIMGAVTHTLLKTRLSIDITQLEQAIARDGTWSGELQHTTSHGREIRVESRLVLLSRDDDDEWLVAEINRDAKDPNRFLR